MHFGVCNCDSYGLVQEDRVDEDALRNGVNESNLYKFITMHIELFWEGEFIEWGLVISMTFDMDPSGSAGEVSCIRL